MKKITQRLEDLFFLIPLACLFVSGPGIAIAFTEEFGTPIPGRIFLLFLFPLELLVLAIVLLRLVYFWRMNNPANFFSCGAAAGTGLVLNVVTQLIVTNVFPLSFGMKVYVYVLVAGVILIGVLQIYGQMRNGKL